MEIESVIRVGDDSFRISWNEHCRNQALGQDSHERHTLELSYALGTVRPHDFTSLRLNPLGLKISRLHLSDELTDSTAHG